MLLRFRVSNFASLRDEQELSLVALDEHPGLATGRLAREDLRVLPAVGIFGANASGKSNVIKAVEFARDAVRNSHQRWLPDEPIPRWPFRLDDDSAGRPSEFAFDILVEDVRYEYGFALDDSSIRREWLYAYPKRRRQIYFEREGDGLRFGNNLTGHRELIADVVRPNSLFLSAAAANNHPQLTPLYQWFGPPHLVSVDHWVFRLLSPQPVSARVLTLLRFADFGIVDAQVLPGKPHSMPEPGRPNRPKREMVHLARNHAGQVSLPLEWESSGTKTWFGLLEPVVDTLDHGGLLIVDDLGSSLHPLLVAQLLRLFHDPTTNPSGAQLLFNSHDVGLLGRHHGVRLARDQVWLTEKDQHGATRLFPLTEFRVRDQLDDVEGRYLKGRYGAVPFFDDDILVPPTGSDHPNT